MKKLFCFAGSRDGALFMQLFDPLILWGSEQGHAGRAVVSVDFAVGAQMACSDVGIHTYSEARCGK
ncbi:MAG: hypothetical protein CL799_11300 [Chromatiales bacterium]|jgi:hypothetical protein|nr:hypothetical protein [Chromatiales bacterium]MDP6150919.1 hypothetical protein [Gammaproteobacteria bacterium]MDP7271054.1 hypothetical protein [Gammaproteobacteria bacterium]HJP04329.1 hypothetical protein [Gammaproteobacteria bacterium]